MRKKKSFFLFLTLSSFAIGSLTSITERFAKKKIDNLLPDSSKIIFYSRPGTLSILSTNNKILQKFGPTSLEKLNSRDIPINIKQAFIASEDRRFYSHNGVDLWSITRAITNNIKNKSILEGGSTITQQLARIVFLNQNRTLKRKLKEIALAYKLERELSKEEILAQYINNVYLGSNAYGIADAAWIYFSKTPALLTLEEAALIAGLAPAPSIYSPLVNADLAIRQRKIVLQKMRLEGFISEDQLSTALLSPLNLKPAKPKFSKSTAPFFTTWVQQKLPKLLPKETLEIGGLSIRTSLNLEWQKNAREVLAANTPEEIEGAIVSIEPSTGLVRVLIGGKDFKTSEFNRATQALRSPGSTFKVFPYTAAIKKGYKPEDLLFDTPRCWYGYCPKNFGDLYLGEVSISESFEKSLNTIAIDLLTKVGFKEVISLANKFGVGNEQSIGEYYPLALGAYGETVLNMTGAYAGIANRGIFITPNPIEEIVGPSNEIIWSREINGPQAQKVLSEDVADTMNWMLQQVVDNGTGKMASLKGRVVAGKTGTSEEGRDLWFIGSIPQLTTGVWLGNDNNSSTILGSSDAAIIWKRFMETIEKDFLIINFPKRPKP